MTEPLYPRIYALVRQIPAGKVASYGQISRIVGGCNARMVGYAMSALKSTKEMEDVPWQRVINSQGKCSTFGDGIGDTIQRKLLIEEGIEFDDQGRVFRNDQWWVERPF
jgi:methylated-DNA-protein-cysteine methyltransferase related protein